MPGMRRRELSARSGRGGSVAACGGRAAAVRMPTIALPRAAIIPEADRGWVCAAFRPGTAGNSADIEGQHYRDRYSLCRGPKLSNCRRSRPNSPERHRWFMFIVTVGTPPAFAAKPATRPSRLSPALGRPGRRRTGRPLALPGGNATGITFVRGKTTLPEVT